MSDNRFGRRNFRKNQNKNKIQDDEGASTEVDDMNLILNTFKELSKELDDKHDRYERIFKISRDITIESKRIIFQLHTIDAKKNNKEKVLTDVKNRLQTLCEKNFLAIAKELGNLDPYQYARAYSAGLQEFVEAYTFYEHLSEKTLSSWEDLQEKFCYKLELSTDPIKEEDVKEENKLTDLNTKTVAVSCLVQPIEFMLGVADLTGEIMRRCINSLGSGDIDTCFSSCKVLQSIYSEYLGISNTRNREFSRKIYTLRQSVQKTEHVCYNVKVRGGEAAKWGAVDSIMQDKNTCDIDEGFF